MPNIKVAGAILALIIILLFFRSAFWILIFIVVASLAEIYNIHFRTPVHFEFVKFGTVMSAAAYGAGAGIFVGLVTTVLSKIFSQRIDATIGFSLGGIILIAILAAQFSTIPIYLLGPGLVLLYYLLTTPFNILLGESPGYAFVYVLTSVALNFILFSQVGPRLLPFL